MEEDRQKFLRSNKVGGEKKMSRKVIRVGKKIIANLGFNAMVLGALNFTLLLPVAQGGICTPEKKCPKKGKDVVYCPPMIIICKWGPPKGGPEGPGPCPPDTNQDASGNCCGSAGGGGPSGGGSTGAVAGGIGGSQGNSPYAGAPFAQVNVTDGRLHHVAVDMAMSPKSRVLGPFQVKRHYINNMDRCGHFGWGWYWEFGSTVENVDAADTDIRWLDLNGNTVEFALVGETEEEAAGGCNKEYATDAWTLNWVKPDAASDTVTVGLLGGRQYHYHCLTYGALTSITTLQDKHRVQLLHQNDTLHLAIDLRA